VRLAGRVLVALAVAGVGLAACDGDPARDVAYYKANKAERDKKMAQCQNDPGGLQASPNCVNAKAAMGEVMLDPNNKKMGSIK
jgi:hypothetical protein